MRSRTPTWIVVLLASLLLGSASAPVAGAQSAPAPGQALPEPNDAVTRWNRIAAQVMLDHCVAPANDPLHESRIYAIVHIAIHDALNAIDRRSQPYAYATPRRHPTASPEAAVAGAARSTLLALLSDLPAEFAEPACTPADEVGGARRVAQEFDRATAAVTAEGPRRQGLQLGEAAAWTILALRGDDRSDVPLFEPAQPGDAPGVYRLTPTCPPPLPSTCTETYPGVFLPSWADVTPFALRDSGQVRPRPPYDITSPQYARDLAEVAALGRDTSTVRTADQTDIARFWYESSPLGWNRIARTVAIQTPGSSLWDNARLFGLLNIAMADAYIANFETKRHYNTWRPVTAIRMADTDGNPRTTGDPGWVPLSDTPPVPSYVSGHSVEGAAAARVMAHFFGTDRRSFITCSLSSMESTTCNDDPGAVFRSYTSFSGAAAENALARIYSGIHFRQDVEVGLVQGRRVADIVIRQVLRPRR